MVLAETSVRIFKNLCINLVSFWEAAKLDIILPIKSVYVCIVSIYVAFQFRQAKWLHRILKYDSIAQLEDFIKCLVLSGVAYT